MSRLQHSLTVGIIPMIIITFCISGATQLSLKVSHANRKKSNAAHMTAFPCDDMASIYVAKLKIDLLSLLRIKLIRIAKKPSQISFPWPLRLADAENKCQNWIS